MSSGDDEPRDGGDELEQQQLLTRHAIAESIDCKCLFLS